MKNLPLGTGAPAEILIVEDNPGDVQLTVEAFHEANVCNRIHVARDGLEALDFLYRRGKYIEAPRPDIILLDLNLPRKNGRDVLREIKANESLKRIPVIILTSSLADEDILNAYDLNVNCYISKPVNPDQFMRVIKSLKSFWLTIVELPGE